MARERQRQRHPAALRARCPLAREWGLWSLVGPNKRVVCWNVRLTRERHTNGEVGGMQGAIVYRCSGLVPGREAAGKQLMNDTNAYCDKSVADGKITDYAWYLSGQAGISLLIIRGEMEQLSTMAASPEMFAINTRAMLINTDLSWGYYVTGDSVVAVADLFYETAAQLT
jgi:hypothetical protein